MSSSLTVEFPSQIRIPSFHGGALKVAEMEFTGLQYPQAARAVLPPETATPPFLAFSPLQVNHAVAVECFASLFIGAEKAPNWAIVDVCQTV